VRALALLEEDQGEVQRRDRLARRYRLEGKLGSVDETNTRNRRSGVKIGRCATASA
jgi:hypothetical protein